MKITIKAYDKARGEEGRKLLDKLTIDAQMVYWETEGSARLKYYGIECEKYLRPWRDEIIAQNNYLTEWYEERKI